MRILRDLHPYPVWLNPGHLVATARVLMRGHQLRAIAVMDGTKFLGLVTLEQMRYADESAEVGDFVQPASLAFSPDMQIQDAVGAFIEHDLDYAPLVEGDKYLGLITASLLLKEHRFSWDPQTGLYRADRLREWATTTLEQGTEISLLFFDLNFFKQYNQLQGHLVGDKVLQRVAEFLSSCLTPGRDILVRYGGDEFAVGTILERHEAEQFAHEIKARADEELRDPTGQPITFCIGVAGGRRKGAIARPDVPISAIYDDLVNAASRACMAAKDDVRRRMDGGI